MKKIIKQIDTEVLIKINDPHFKRSYPFRAISRSAGSCIPSDTDRRSTTRKTHAQALTFDYFAKGRRMSGGLDHTKPLDDLEEDLMVMIFNLP